MGKVLFKSQIIITFLLLFIIAISIVSATNSNALQNNYSARRTPENGFIPDKETAIKVAIAVWLPIYGKKIYNEAPYKAKLINDKIWVVEGTLSEGKLGGVSIIKIQKSDGKILMVAHEK